MKPIKARKKASEYFTIIRSGLSNTPRQRMGFLIPTEGLFICNTLLDIGGRGENRRGYLPCIMKEQITILIVLISTLTFGQGKVFSPDKTYLYAVEYTADSITTMDTIKISATGKPWRTDPKKQLEIIISYNLENYDSSIFAEQSSIGWVHSDTTGAVDNDNSCWFHPPRHNQYKMLELAPFPRIEYPLQVDKVYSRILFIGEGWGDISNTKVVWHYRVIDQVGDYWKISAQATPDDKPSNVNQLDFTFSNKEGFTELRYTLYDGTTIEMKLI